MFQILRRNIQTGRVTVEVKAASKAPEDAALSRGIAREPGDGREFELAGAQLREKVRALLGGRSLHIRQVDAGSCNGCELEISALSNPVYDIERFGVHFVASPRHADILLVTGPVTRQMEEALRRTYEAVPEPRIVIASGDCAVNCGVFAGSYAVAGPVESVIPVDVKILGCPPAPIVLLRAILAAVDCLPPIPPHSSSFLTV